MAKTLTEIEKQIAELQKQADEIKKAESAEALKEVKELIALYGFTAKDLDLKDKKGAKASGTKAPVKYQQGEQTWTGRGKKPTWVNEFEASGGKLEDIAV